MFKKLAQIIQNLQKNQGVFDPSRFNDPVAKQTNWTPAKGGGSNFRTHKLVKVSPTRVEFKTTLGAILFSLIFAVVGLTLIIFTLLELGISSMKLEIIILLLMGSIFAGIGGYLLNSQTRPIVFDRQKGFFWKGRMPRQVMSVGEPAAKYARLETIHALQIIAEYISSKNGGYHSFELNVVLKDGKRINVIDHGNRYKLAEDARILSEFLGIPVWDATIM